MAIWPADKAVIELLEEVKFKAHLPRLEKLKFCVSITDGPAFVKDRLYLGRVTRIPECYRMRQKEPADFEITISGGTWGEILKKPEQRAALLDLHLTRVQPVYKNEVIIENKKRVVAKDEFGRIKKTEEVKVDKNGEPMWTIDPLDMRVIVQNIRRYGFWFDDLAEVFSVVKSIAIHVEGSVMNCVS